MVWHDNPAVQKLKGLKKENLRDNMSDLELVLTMLAEATTTEISKTVKPATFSENQKVAQKAVRLREIPGKRLKIQQESR